MEGILLTVVVQTTLVDGTIQVATLDGIIVLIDDGIVPLVGRIDLSRPLVARQIIDGVIMALLLKVV